MKALFLHVPKFNNYYKPVGEFMWINYMPMGFLAIADLLNRNGHEVEVVHLGVEWVVRHDFKVDELLADRPDIRAVGLTLHWHYQAFDVIEVAKRLKNLRPDLFVFLGGYTASIFHEEIVRDFPAIDAVIRGDGEGPALALLDALEAGDSLDGVANLTWRDGREVRVNNRCYVGSEEDINALDFANFSLLRHADTYVKYIGLPFFYAKRFTPEQNFKQFTIRSPLFPVNVGRGCPFTCTWCGGSHKQQKHLVSGRTGFIYRSHDSVIASVRSALAAGYRTMHTATDPEPVRQEYFVELWRRIRAEGIETNWMFECNGLPSDAFVEQFHKTFPGPDSIIAMSPECGNEAMRLAHKGPAFTTAAFLDKLDRLDAMGISLEVFFSYGLPGENEDLLQDTIALRRTIIKRYKHVRGLRTLSIEMEPGAPWQTDPERYGIITNRRTFADFYQAHVDGSASTYDTFGYYIPDYFKKPLDPRTPYEDFAKRMQAIKCREFCFIHPNPKKFGKPWQGRLMCAIASRLVRLKPYTETRPY